MVDVALSPVRVFPARWRPILGWWVASRLVTLGAFAVTAGLGPRGYFGPRLYTHPFELLGAWDGVWYRRVAEHGYLLVPGRQSDPAFFPLFPILLRALHGAGVPYTVAGATISAAALAVGLVAFYELSRRVVAEELARRAAVFAAIAPLAFVYSMSYPASLLLALVALAYLAALDDRWLLTAALAAAAALARPEAIVVVLPLAALAWRRRDALDAGRRGRALAAVLAAPAALVSFPLYLAWAIDDPRAWGKAQESWGRAFHLDGPWRTGTTLGHQLHVHPWFARDLALLVVYGALLAVAARAGAPRAWTASALLVLALPLFSGSIESEGRFGLLALPVYWGLAALTRRRAIDVALRLASLALLVAGVLTLPYVWP